MKNRIRFIEIRFTCGFLGTDVLHSQATTLPVRLPEVVVYGLLYFLLAHSHLTPYDLDLWKLLWAPGHLLPWLFLGILHLHLPELYDAADHPILPKTLKILSSGAFAHKLWPPHSPLSFHMSLRIQLPAGHLHVHVSKTHMPKADE